MKAPFHPLLLIPLVATSMVGALALSVAVGTTLFRYVAAQGGVTLGFWPALGTLAAAMFVSRLAGSGAKAVADVAGYHKTWVPAIADVVASTLAWVAVVPMLTGLSWEYTFAVALAMSLFGVVLAIGLNLGVRRLLST